MVTTSELRQGELARRVEEYRTAFQARDVEGMLELFADDAELTAAPGTFRGRLLFARPFSGTRGYLRLR
jgi:ketosteroid isomerase-like protein